MAHFDKSGQIRNVWIFDQFSSTKGGTTDTRRFLAAGANRMIDRKKWGLE